MGLFLSHSFQSNSITSWREAGSAGGQNKGTEAHKLDTRQSLVFSLTADQIFPFNNTPIVSESRLQKIISLGLILDCTLSLAILSIQY